MPLWLAKPSTSWPAAKLPVIDTVAPVSVALSMSARVRSALIAVAGAFLAYEMAPVLGASTGASLTALTVSPIEIVSVAVGCASARPAGDEVLRASVRERDRIVDEVDGECRRRPVVVGGGGEADRHVGIELQGARLRDEADIDPAAAVEILPLALGRTGAVAGDRDAAQRSIGIGEVARHQRRHRLTCRARVLIDRGKRDGVAVHHHRCGVGRAGARRAARLP